MTSATSPVPFAITIAPNGARRMKADHAPLPMTKAEIVREAAACADAGASLIHVHVRDRDGGHVLDADLFRDVLAGIRAEVGERLVLQATTEAVGRYSAPEQMAFVRDLKPEAASMALSEFTPDETVEAPAAAFFEWVHQQGILAQYILYKPEEVERFRSMMLRGLIPQERPHVLFVLGRYAERQVGDPRELVDYVQAWGEAGPWSMCCFGPGEARAGLIAGAFGGHVRVGFENNVVLADGSPAPSNAALAAQMRDAASLLGRPVAEANWLREHLF